GLKASLKIGHRRWGLAAVFTWLAAAIAMVLALVYALKRARRRRGSAGGGALNYLSHAQDA
ncbi:MAG: hypothetical protein DRJ96_09035, partial [Thermoprotei archaeon]